MNKRPYKKKAPGFPVTNRDWFNLINDMPIGCIWAVIALIILAALKSWLFP